MDTVADSGTSGYVHGYSEGEARRLGRQADALAALLHDGTAYPAGNRVLEAGCGVGAQTVHLAAGSPGARIVAVDRNASSLAKARDRVTAAVPVAEVEWCHADLIELPFLDGAFDHVFVCFVLEHVPRPGEVLAELRRVLCPGGTLTAVEGDHGSVFFHPDSDYAQATILHQTRVQAAAGGNALLGRELHPLLTDAGFEGVTVAPVTVVADPSRPDLVEGFTRQTFIPVMESVRDEVLAAGLADAADWDRGIADLHRTAGAGGTFHYTYCKALGVKPVG